MKAEVGDRIVIAPGRVDGPVRDGEILAVGPGGGPPFQVRWSENGSLTLFFPGPDAHVQHLESEPDVGRRPPEPTELAREPGPSHTKSWRVDLYLYEGAHSTSAQAVLHGDAPSNLKTVGVARRRSDVPDIPEIGDEVAAARALNHLADLLRQTAETDLDAVTGHKASVDL